MKTERHAKASVVRARTLRKVRISWPPSFGRGLFTSANFAFTFFTWLGGHGALLIVLVYIIIPCMLYLLHG